MIGKTLQFHSFKTCIPTRLRNLCCLKCCILFLLCAIITPSHGQEPAQNPIKIGVVYNDTDFGQLYLKGTLEALKNHPIAARIDLHTYPYHGQKVGFELIQNLMSNQEVDLIFGPTDSQVYYELLKIRGELEQHQVPLISSLIAGAPDNRSDGWFFRTNVGLARRAHVIYDHLNKYWLRRMAVLYHDSEAGRQAEEAFRTELTHSQLDNYQALPYDLIGNVREELREILKKKPEALGIFGTKEDIYAIYQSLQAMNHSISSYNPLLFTVIDGRLLQNKLSDIYYVALTDVNPTINHLNPPIKLLGDVDGLAFDTTWLSLNELERISPETKGPALRQQFRERFISLLLEGQSSYQPVTQMHFSGMENKAIPKVYHMTNKIVAIDAETSVNFGEKIWLKIELVWRGVGFYPILITFMFLVIAYILGFHEISMRYPDIRYLIIRRFNFHLIVWFNFSVVWLLYLAMAEIGSIPYDDVLAALMIGFTAKTLLHSTILETPAGKAIGLAEFHDRLINWLGERIMVTAYESEQSNINVIAYHNTLQGMVNELHSIYNNAKSTKLAREMNSSMEKELEREPSLLRKRKICARRLLRRLSWRKLQELGFAPQSYTEKAKDPEGIIRAAVDYCLEDEKRVESLEKIVLDKISKSHEIRSTKANAKALQERVQKDVKDHGTEDRVKTYIGYLFLYFGYTEQQLIDAGFLEDPGWIQEDAILACIINWKRWVKLQEYWNGALKALNRKERKRWIRKLRSAPTARQAIATQLELIKENTIFSRRRLTEIDLCFSKNEIFTYAYLYCRHPKRKEASLMKLREMVRDPKIRQRLHLGTQQMKTLPNGDDPLEIARHEENRRQQIKQLLRHLINKCHYGPFSLTNRDLFPNPEALIDQSIKYIEAQKIESQLRKKFYLEMRDAEPLTKHYCKQRLMDGAPFLQRLISHHQFLVLTWHLPMGNLTKLEKEKLRFMIRVLMHKCDYQSLELIRLGLITPDAVWMDDLSTTRHEAIDEPSIRRSPQEVTHS